MGIKTPSDWTRLPVRASRPDEDFAYMEGCSFATALGRDPVAVLNPDAVQQRLLTSPSTQHCRHVYVKSASNSHSATFQGRYHPTTGAGHCARCANK